MDNAEAWSVAQRAIADARDGRLTVLVIEAGAGYGKSRLLRRIAGELDDFDVRRAFGEPDAPDVAFRTLSELVPAAAPDNAFQGIGMLLSFVDAPERSRPAAFVIDDLQWADAESVRTIAGLLRRVVGDRVFVVIATRPLGREHGEFQRVLRDVDAESVSLDGLTRGEVADLVAARHDGTTTGDLPTALHDHTGGNPLHVIALLAEHSVASLVAMADADELPAPLELAATVEARLQELAPDAAELLCALAVLGDAWTPVETAGRVAGIADPRTAARILATGGLIRSRGTGAAAEARIHHAVSRAAVYEILADDKRRALHERSAASVDDAGARLRHRAQASTLADDELRDDLVDYASERHRAGEFREAARFLMLAAAAAGPEDRAALVLDAEFESLLGRDASRSREHARSGDVRERLVVAMSLAQRAEWSAAWSLLADISDAELATVPDRIAYRVRAVRVHAATGCGRPDAETLADITAAEALEPDPAIERHIIFAKAHTLAWVLDEREYWQVTGLGRDRRDLVTTPQGRSLLAWRGITYAMDGRVDDAIGDLSIVTALVGSGGLDFTEGNYHALLGLAQFLSGDSARAAASIEIALSTGLAHTHPVTLAVSALRELVTGDRDTARQASADVRTATLRNRYRGALFAADVVDVLVLALADDDAARSDWVRRRRHELGHPRDERLERAPALWLAASGISCAWADDPQEADEWADRLADLVVAPDWRDDMVRWLRARAGVARGVEASAELQDLARTGFASIPVLRDLVAKDAAAFSDAAAPGSGAPASDPLAPLSERERAVVALVAAGMSYAQIAKELYISRSTVGFHLSNCYAKTGTASRHELADLARSAGL